MDVGRQNLNHALDNGCEDLDCEIHNPDVIETDAERLTAQAWFYAGGMAFMEKMDEQYSRFGAYNSDSIAKAIIEFRSEYNIHRAP